jgi:general secretion pathway protein C
MSLLRPVVYGLYGFDRFTGLLVVLARDIRSALEWPLAGTIDPKSVSKTMNIRRSIIFAYVMCVTFLVAHIINGVIAEALSVPVGLVRPSPASDREAELRASVPAMVEHIRTSGLFPLPPDPIGIGMSTAGPGGPGAPPSRAPLNLASKLKLLGVVIGDHNGVSAIVEELSSKRQLFFRLHDQIPDVGEISEIRRDGMVVRQGDQQELLELAASQIEKPPSAPVTAGSAVAPVPGSPVRTVLDRRYVEQSMGDLPKLLSQARAVPYMVNGAMNGFRLDFIAPSSFYEKIGLKYGDVLQQVNGVDVRDPGTMLTLFQQLRNEKTVKLDVLRNNQRTAMTFDIR